MTDGNLWRFGATAAGTMLAAALLAGCNGGAGGGNSMFGNSVFGNSASGTSGATSTSSNSDQSADAKISAYTEAYNALIDTFGLPKTAERYNEENISRRSPTDSLSITDGWVESGLAKLKEARAKPGTVAGLDASADALIAALDKVMARLKPLNAYYDSKAYREDGLARGKSEDAAMKAEFAASLAALEQFNTALSRERRARIDGQLQALKARGDTLGYNNKLALRQAEDLVDLFAKPEDVRNPAVIARADAIVASLEKLLAEQRTAYAAAKAKASPTDQPDSGYESVVDNITSMIGDYRDVKQSRDPSDFNDVVEEYNRAVDSANRID